MSPSLVICEHHIPTHLCARCGAAPRAEEPPPGEPRVEQLRRDLYYLTSGKYLWGGTMPEDAQPNAMAKATIDELCDLALRASRPASAPAGSAPDPALWVLRRIIEELPSKRDWLDPDLESAAWALLRGAAPTASAAAAPEHVCGLSGYNPMIDPPCPGCQARHASAAAAEPDGETLEQVIGEWLDGREWSEDCWCDAPDAGTCWYHMTAAEQRAERIRSLAERLRGAASQRQEGGP